MKIVEVNPFFAEFIEEGFKKAIMIELSYIKKILHSKNIQEEHSLIQAIIDFARNEGHGESIVKDGEEERILIQKEEIRGAQAVFFVWELTRILKSHLEQSFV